MSWGSSSFTHGLRLVLVDRSTGREVGTVDGLKRKGRISRNQDSEAKESGTVEVVGVPDFGSRLARLYADVDFTGGGSETVCLGTFVPSFSSRKADGTLSTVSVDLTGRLSELAGDMFDAPVTFPAGTPTVAAAAQIAREAGFEVVSDASTHVLAASRTYGIDDESKLHAVNDLLDAAGFSSATTDAMGRIVLSRYVEPSQRPAVPMHEGEAKLLREVTDELDSSEVPNVVHAVYETSDATVVGVAVDSDPASQWSTVGRGYRVVRVYRYSDAATQAKADEKAASMLAQSRSVVHRVTFSHVFDPSVTVGSVVDLQYPTAGVSARLAVRTQDIDLGDGLIVKAEGREHRR